MSAPSWEARLKGEHPNLHQLFLGERPGSYAAVIADFKALLDEYVAANLEGTKPIKAALFQAGAHLNLLATGTATGADVSAEDFLKQLRSMADEAMKAINRGVHATAVQNGLDRKLVLPKVPKKTPLQDQFCKYLTSGFKKKVTAILAEDRFSQLDADEALVTVMLLHAAYVDANLRGDTTLAQLIPGFLAPDDKDFLRAMVKLLGDYFGKKIPAAHLLDIVRRSGTGTLEEHEEAIRQLVALKSGKIKRFVLTRIKETLTDAAADIKFVNLGVAYTPTTVNAKGKDVAITYGDMTADPLFATLAKAVQQKNELSDQHIEAATRMLSHKSLAKHPITMIIEFQLYHPLFLDIKRKLHGIYKLCRADTLLDLVKDLLKYAKNPAMAYKAQAGEYNEAYKLRVQRDFGALGLGTKIDSNGTLFLYDNSKLQQLMAKQPGKTTQTLMQYCEAFGCKKLGLDSNSFGDETGKALAQALTTNTTLTRLDLENNNLNTATKDAIEKAWGNRKGNVYV